MLNEDKIRYMPKAAAFEERERGGAFRTNRFFWWDYVTTGMLRALIGVTLSAVLILILWGAIHLEELLTGVQVDAMIQIGMTALRWYIPVAAVYLLISFVVYVVKYRRSEKKMEQYLSLLGRIERMNEKTESEKKTDGRKRER